MDESALKQLCLLDELRIVESSLQHGFGHLQNISLENDQYFPALYFLATALERFMKCCKCIIIKAETGNFPTLGELKSRYGHNIEQLHKALADDFEKYVNIKEEVIFLRTDSLLTEMLHLLSEFARSARYYNLDFITQGSKSNTLDVQSMWSEFEIKVFKQKRIEVADLSKDPYPQIAACLVGKLERLVQNLLEILYRTPIFDVCKTFICCVMSDFRRIEEFGIRNYRMVPENQAIEHYNFIETNQAELEQQGYICKVVNKIDHPEDEWPFYVDEVTVTDLGCSVLAIEINGLLYGLNGPGLTKYRLPDPHKMGVAKMGKSIGPFIDIGLDLKKNK